MKEWIMKVAGCAGVKSAAVALLKALVTAGLTLAGLAATSGCSSLTPSTKSQSVTAFGIGLPAVVWVTNGTQEADNSGDDRNRALQSQRVTEE